MGVVMMFYTFESSFQSFLLEEFLLITSISCSQAEMATPHRASQIRSGRDYFQELCMNQPFPVPGRSDLFMANLPRKAPMTVGSLL
jgi:hypothetical protein